MIFYTTATALVVGYLLGSWLTGRRHMRLRGEERARAAKLLKRLTREGAKG